MYNSKYYYELNIEDNIERFTFPDSSVEEKHITNSKSYYKVYLSENNSIKKIEYYCQEHLLQSVYLFSNKGNLISFLYYAIGKASSKIIKTIYDYSFGKKTIKEKRFFNLLGIFLKKEFYHPRGYLLSIQYFHENKLYCIEHFDENERLINTDYYGKNGLKIL